MSIIPDVDSSEDVVVYQKSMCISFFVDGAQCAGCAGPFEAYRTGLRQQVISELPGYRPFLFRLLCFRFGLSRVRLGPQRSFGAPVSYLSVHARFGLHSLCDAVTPLCDAVIFSLAR